jgi:predicted amidophosphoribosyltransferase
MGTKCSPELLIPVPLHASRLQQRGYNQSEAIARGMAAVLGKEVTTKLLIREGSGRGQTRASRLNRWSNVETKFNCLPADYAVNTHIGLIDDVLTTGATLEACHRALDKAGYRHISAFTLAYAEY